MATGRVKWFDNRKGFGFIEQESGEDVFVHYTNIDGAGFRTLEDGEPVQFEIVTGAKGLAAQKVTRMNPETAAPAAPPVVAMRPLDAAAKAGRAAEASA